MEAVTMDNEYIAPTPYGKSGMRRKSKYERVMDGMERWVAFYRANPHRFAVDYLGMTWMRLFRKYF